MQRACLDCGALSDQPRCPKHRKAANRRHNAKRLRGSGWQRIRGMVLKRDHLRCTFTVNGERCTATEGLEVHHRDGDRNNNHLPNLVLLCSHHHDLLTYNR